MLLEKSKCLEQIQMGSQLILKSANSNFPESLDIEIPNCSDWDMRQLCGHVGFVYRFMGAHIAKRSTEPPGGGDMPKAPEADEDLLEWYQESENFILETLRNVDGDEPVWNWFAEENKAIFWFRRLMHETLIHAYDATVSVNDPLQIEPDLGADGVDEFLCAILPPTVKSREDLKDPAGTFHLHRTDVGENSGEGAKEGLSEWFCEMQAGEAQITYEHAKGDAALQGSGADLMLAVWHRLPLNSEKLTLLGDVEVANQWLTYTP